MTSISPSYKEALGNFTQESVALQLTLIVLMADGKKVGDGHAQYPKEYASRAEILDAYSECIDAVRGGRVKLIAPEILS